MSTVIIVVDSATTLLSLLDDLTGLAVDPPSLYLDLEGVKLGRHGSISIVSLYLPPKKKIYLIDIYRLGKTAFSTTNSNKISLKTILESPTIPKVIFDIRNDSDALFSHFKISVDGIQDLQLMELATRKGSMDFVNGLAKCVEKDSPISAAAKADWQRTKESAIRLYDPRKGGRYEIFNERPMKPEIIQYCAWDVALLPGLYNIYNAKLCLPGEAFWQAQVQEATKDRIKLSQSPRYDGQAESKVHGPWSKWDIEQAIEAWNDNVLDNALLRDEEIERDLEAWNDEEMLNALTGDNGDEGYDDDFDDVTARDCMGWEEDMIKNGEYF